MNLILFGPPGAGKGTQSELLVKRNQMHHISTGDLFRAAIKNSTALGQKAKAFMDAGQLVPDEIVIGMVEEVLHGLKGQSFILDGFPRTAPQADALNALLKQNGISIGKAVFLEVPRTTLLSRLAGRRVCNSCGTVYHVDTKPTKVAGICDKCGGQVIQRKDDHEDVVRTRLEAYDTSTSPLKAYFARQGIYSEVSGTGSTEDVYARIAQLFA